MLLAHHKKFPPKTLRRSRVPSLAARFVVAATSLLFVLGQVGSFQHLAEVQHVRCAEHGELIDVPSAAAVQPSVSSGTARHAVLDVGAGARAEHKHEHCAMVPQRRHDAIAELPAQAHAHLPAVASRYGEGQGCLSVASVALYRLAPKNSPPV